jgi:hypothetical protein
MLFLSNPSIAEYSANERLAVTDRCGQPEGAAGKSGFNIRSVAHLSIFKIGFCVTWLVAPRAKTSTAH